MKTRLAVGVLVGLIGAVIIGGCGPTFVAKFDAGASLQKQENYLQAIEMYREYIAEYPDSPMVPHAFLRVARCYVGLGDKPNAMATYEKIGEQFPTSEVASWAEAEMRDVEKQDLVPDAPPEE